MTKKCANCYWYFKCEYAKAKEPACRAWEPEQVDYSRYPATKEEVLIKALKESYEDLVNDYASAWSYANSKVVKNNL